MLPDTSGAPNDLSKLRGKVALVTFFATWCFPCLVEIPVFRQLQADYGPQGFQAVAIGMDLEGPKVLAPFAQTYDLPYPVLVATDEVRDGRTSFGPITDLPTTFLFDRKGALVAAWRGPVNPKGLSELVGRLVR